MSRDVDRLVRLIRSCGLSNSIPSSAEHTALFARVQRALPTLGMSLAGVCSAGSMPAPGLG